MGVFNCKVSVSNLEGSDLREIDAPVDTGATYTVLPTHLLHELGISPMRKGTFVMGDGRRVATDIGHGWITINGYESPYDHNFWFGRCLASPRRSYPGRASVGRRTCCW